MKRVTLLAICLVTGLGLVAPVAHAQLPDKRGVIVQVEDGHIFADTSKFDVAEEDVFDIYRRIEVTNPVTKEKLVDYFVIGELRVVQTSSSLSWLGAHGLMAREPRVGDIVVPDGWHEQRTEGTSVEPSAEEDSDEATEVPPAPSTQPTRAVKSTASADPRLQTTEERELIEAWYATLGLSPKERVGIYRKYLRRNPSSRHRRGVQMAIDDLRQQEGRQARRSRSRVDKFLGQRLTRTTEGAPTHVAFAAIGGGAFPEAMLMVRANGRNDFESIIMHRDGEHFFAKVPQALVAPDGFEYYVQGIRSDGTTLPVVANPLRPQVVTVARLKPEPSLENDRSAVRFVSELVNFNNFEGDDWYLLAEADFLYRAELSWLYSVRLGYGHIEGRGGRLEEYDEPGFEPSDVRFTYGYLETEIKIIELLSVMGRLTIGLGQNQEFEDSGLRAGAQLRVRIGDERGTNLVVAGETIPELGQRAFVGLTWYASELFPMRAEVHVTDQPVNQNDLAVRGVLELGWQGWSPLEIAVRLSYQGRRIDHAGLGAGLSLAFNW